MIIEEVLVSPSILSGFGENALTQPIYPGEVVNLPLLMEPGNCLYNIHIRSVTGPYLEINDLNLCNTNTVVVHDTLSFATTFRPPRRH